MKESPQQSLDSIAAVIPDLLFDNMSLSDFISLSAVNKNMQRVLSQKHTIWQKLVNTYFPYVIQNNHHDFKKNPMQLFIKEFNFYKNSNACKMISMMYPDPNNGNASMRWVMESLRGKTKSLASVPTVDCFNKENKSLQKILYALSYVNGHHQFEDYIEDEQLLSNKHTNPHEMFLSLNKQATAFISKNRNILDIIPYIHQAVKQGLLDMVKGLLNDPTLYPIRPLNIDDYQEILTVACEYKQAAIIQYLVTQSNISLPDKDKLLKIVNNKYPEFQNIFERKTVLPPTLRKENKVQTQETEKKLLPKALQKPPPKPKLKSK